MPQSVEEIYLEFSLPDDYNVLYEHVENVFVPVGYKDRYVYNVQRSNPWYTGDNVKEIDFEEKNFTIETAEGYGTYYTDRPFVMPEGAEGGIIKGFDDEGILDIDYRYKAGDIVPANMGILLKGAPGTYDYEPTFYFEAPYAPGNNLLEGSTEDMQLPESDDLYYMLSYDDNGENIGFYWGANFGRPFLNKAHHAYFALPKSEAAGAKAFLLGPNPSTGIGTVVENDDATATVYTLTGTKVTTPVDDLPRGIYIINGKKTLIK